MTPNKKIRVLVIDDSALMRKLLVEFLSQDAQIDVIGTAPDPLVARDKIKALNPDVLTLDVEMPRMDGLTFLENLMRLRPMPVVMVSSLTERGAEVTLQALELGAVDFVTKPKIDLEAGVRQYAQDLIMKIKAAANARVRGLGMTRPTPQPRPSKLFRTTDRIIAIGASTGGTEAIKDVLAMMPANAPAILITQHIPAAFSAPFAARMDRSSAMSVCEARDGQLIIPGHVYIAPGDWHLSLARDGARYVCRLDQAPPENRHRPSVDVLFKSVARHAGANAVAAVLTGMGDDGARGLLAMREAGARTLVQDEASSVVWGMPGAAFKLGGAEQICDLQDIAGRLLAHCDALAA
ncbi:protein-glutamate methylesterase/protein-glutamine glutaminase [Hydrocarboniphaga sp.]|uniref:protein-glutamate methylesterase/protein-glutamine glutaminase n=1 Tax=Hydrocarboniphaga sp. TaxID=2033016 RepID=UPI003D0DAF7B